MKRTSERKTIWVFTPSRTNPEDLEYILVQRQELLKDAVERVRESALTNHKHHLLFVGPRGCGKTHLVTLIVSRLSDDDALTDRLRIAWLNEDETCTTLLELLLKIHAALEKRYPEEYREEMLSAAYEMKPDTAQDFVSQHILASLASRTLLVVTENLDAIFEGLGDAGQKQLRAFIQENPKLSILATAQRLVDDLSRRTSPFFGFFQTEHLKPLNVEEATELLQNIARLNGETEVVDFLSTSRGRSRVRALHHLSGGNHRIYIVLSQFITRDSIDALLGPFMKMVDELTPYYQERIRWLPTQQRKIVEYLCSCEGTAPVKEIAKRLFASPQTISSQLQDLREKGYVEANQRGRESLYEISEPLMRICVEVKENQRHEPLRLLVDFLRVWYDDKQLNQHMGKLQVPSASHAYLEAALLKNSVEGNLRKRLFLEELKSSLSDNMNPVERANLLQECTNSPEAIILSLKNWHTGDKAEARRCIDEAIDEETNPSSRGHLFLFRGELHDKLGDREKAIEDYTAVIELSGTPAKQVAMARVNRGIIHRQTGETQLAFKDYTAVIGLSGAPVEQVAVALLLRAMVRHQMGETQHAIEDCTAVIRLSGAPVEQIAMALLYRGMTHGEMGEMQRAIEDCTAVIGFSCAQVGEIALALFGRGIALDQIGETQRAIEDLTAVIGLSGAPLEPVAMALHYRGLSSFRQGRRKEAQVDFEALVQLTEAPRESIVDACLVLAELHWSEGRWTKGFKAINEGLQRGAREKPPYYGTATALVDVAFSVGLSPDGRRSTITDLLNIYAKHLALPVLGEAVVQHIGKIFRSGEPWPSTDNLEQWASAWEQASETVTEFRLSVRLLRTGVDFVKTGGKDPGVLLSLSSAERAILQQALGIDEM